jgi:hypothetical protein
MMLCCLPDPPVFLEDILIVIVCPGLTGLDKENYEDAEKEKDDDQEK